MLNASNGLYLRHKYSAKFIKIDGNAILYGACLQFKHLLIFFEEV